MTNLKILRLSLKSKYGAHLYPKKPANVPQQWISLCLQNKNIIIFLSKFRVTHKFEVGNWRI